MPSTLSLCSVITGKDDTYWSLQVPLKLLFVHVYNMPNILVIQFAHLHVMQCTQYFSVPKFPKIGLVGWFNGFLNWYLCMQYISVLFILSCLDRFRTWISLKEVRWETESCLFSWKVVLKVWLSQISLLTPTTQFQSEPVRQLDVEKASHNPPSPAKMVRTFALWYLSV